MSDGSEWFMYEPIEGTAGQFARGSATARSTTALGILMGTVDLGAYEPSLRDPSRGDPTSTVGLVLVPRRPDPHHRRIVLFVDARETTRGAVRQVRIEDPDGNWNWFDFAETDFDAVIDASTFRFTPPPGAREISTPR